jgi:hypothetical protein
MAGSGVSVRVDTRELEQLRQALAGIGNRHLTAVYRKALRKAADPIANEVRQRYSQFSRRIPRAVRIKVRQGGRVVVIEVGGTPTTMHARTVEGLPSGGPARHPVFAKGPRSEWAWVAQTPPRQVVAKVVAARADSYTRDVVALFIRALEDHL